MAANEDRTALWKTPLSTPLRSNENGFQDLFKHSEKLLASAVSICRLKGSIECQTGGIITVCEEMQRLLRLSFNETARLEKELKKQKQTWDEDISFLKERLAYLEDTKDSSKCSSATKPNKTCNSERLPLKLSTSENAQEDINSLQVVKTPSVKLPINEATEMTKSTESKFTNENPISSDNTLESSVSNNSITEPKDQENLTDNQDEIKETSTIVGNDKIVDKKEESDSSLEVSVFDLPNKTKPKSNNRKSSSKTTSKGSSKGRKMSAKKSISLEKTPISNNGKEDTENEITESKSAEIDAKGREYKNSKAKKRSSTKLLEEKEKKSYEDSEAVVFDANDSAGSDIFLNPESGLLEMKEFSDVDMNEGRREESSRKNRKTKAPKEKASTVLPTKNSKKEQKPKKTVKKNVVAKDTKSIPIPTKTTAEVYNDVHVPFIPESPKSSPLTSLQEPFPGNSTNGSNKDGQITSESTPSTKHQASVEEPEEILGDMSFLIDMSSMISSFVSSNDSSQIELPLMQARERADARKLAGLFNLHISIGNKMENRSSLILSKTANSQMPKPGKLDNLLSKLSIAAAKEAERLSSKARNKRKFKAAGDDASFSEESGSQPAKSATSRNKKAKI